MIADALARIHRHDHDKACLARTIGNVRAEQFHTRAGRSHLRKRPVHLNTGTVPFALTVQTFRTSLPLVKS